MPTGDGIKVSFAIVALGDLNDATKVVDHAGKVQLRQASGQLDSEVLLVPRLWTL